MSSRDTCLTLDAFRKLADHTADAADVRRWASHLAGCRACTDTTKTLQAGPTVLAAVTAVLGPREPLLAAVRATIGEPTPPPNEWADHNFQTLDRVLPARPSAAVTTPLARTPARPLRPSAATAPPPARAAKSTMVCEITPTVTPPEVLPPAVPVPPPPRGLAAPEADDEIGRVGQYRVLRLLGAGAVGLVYLAEDVYLKRMVALKLMRPDDTTDEMARERFLREGQAAASLEHENVVAVYQVGEANGTPFLAMQLLQGETLDERLKRDKTVPPVEAVRIAREITAGLAAAHDRGLVHRDVKPANIWLEAGTGRVKLLDFGLARTAGESSHLTRTGTVVGTPAYMSPEQGRGANVDLRTDLYSLGAVLYTMLAGVPPFTAPDTMSMLIALATDHPRPITSHNPHVPPPLVGLINRLLVKHPDGRPASAHDVLATLDTIERLLPRLLRDLSPEGWAAQPAAGDAKASGVKTLLVAAALLVTTAGVGSYLLNPTGVTRALAGLTTKWTSR